jgi:hypothetical protein
VPRAFFRRDPAPDRSTRARAAPDVSDASNESSNPTGEVRPRFHKLATKLAPGGFAMPRERCDDPSAAVEGFSGLPYPPDGSILAVEATLSGKYRVR